MNPLILVLSLCGPAAFATLGTQSLSSTNAALTVQTTNSHGTTIREYADSSGLIYAVTWKGFKEPDLSLLLGSYYAEYRTELTNLRRQPGRKPVAMATSQITVHKWGHMRAFRGRAYLTGRLPNGVKVEDLQ